MVQGAQYDNIHGYDLENWYRALEALRWHTGKTGGARGGRRSQTSTLFGRSIRLLWSQRGQLDESFFSGVDLTRRGNGDGVMFCDDVGQICTRKLLEAAQRTGRVTDWKGAASNERCRFGIVRLNLLPQR